MKKKSCFMMLMTAMLLSMSLYAQDQRGMTSEAFDRYDGVWSAGEGILYSYKDGLIIGTFSKGKAEGRCVCYKPNGEVYWGDFKKGKATGHGRIYRDNGIVVSGYYKNGRYHGTDTLYRSNGTVHIGKYRKGKLKGSLSTDGFAGRKPDYPRVDMRRKQEEFLKELEIRWEERNYLLREKAGLVSPKFQGGDIDDFALWVNSQIDYPLSAGIETVSRTVIVEFTVMKDGTLSDINAVFGSDVILNEAAVKAVSKSPRWEPGHQNGEKKNIRMSVPVVFSM